MKRSLYSMLLLAVLAAPNVFSCGPFFDHTLYAYTLHPDLPLSGYAAGNLGIVQPTYARSYLYVAYMYLEGRRFPPAAQQDLVSFWQYRFTFWPNKHGTFAQPKGEEFVAEYLRQRQKFAGAATKIDNERPIGNYEYLQNCNSDAFRVAAATLTARTHAWGVESADLKEWLAGQDLVFGACSGAIPSLPRALPASATPLLRADRDYQTAAANFYLGRFDEAAAEFERIAADKGSPWAARAPYLRVRALIRKATLGPDSQEQENLATAERALDALLADKAQRALHADLRRLRAFVELRLHPEQRAAELAKQLSDPNDANLAQDLWDFLALADVALGDDPYAGRQPPGPLPPANGFRGRGDMADWIVTFGNQTPEAAEHAYAKWQQTKSATWLVAAMSLAKAKGPHVAELAQAATALPEDSPALTMANYHAARLLAGSDAAAARTRLAAIPAEGLAASAAHQIQAQRALAAASLSDFVASASAVPVVVANDDTGEELDVEWGSLDGPRFAGRPQRPGLLPEVAAAFNTRMPLSAWSTALDQAQWPAAVRADFALAGWARALVLGKPDDALAFAKAYVALRPQHEKWLHDFLAAAPEDRRRAGLFALSNLPGARPYVVVDSRTTPLEKIDNYRDNWWCGDVGADLEEPNYSKQTWNEQRVTSRERRPAVTAPAFLSAEERTAGATEWQKLAASRSGPYYIADQVLAWAAAAPADERLPEAMFRAVRVARYGCGDKASDALIDKVVATLQKKYPRSPWTSKARRYHQ